MERVMKIGVEGDAGTKNFSTYVIEGAIDGYGIHGYGKDAHEAIADTYTSIAEMRELARECGDEFPDNIRLEIYFSDLGAFFSYYPFLNISAVAKRTGINAALMRKYASGVCRPSQRRLAEIQSKIRAMANELTRVNFG